MAAKYIDVDLDKKLVTEICRVVGINYPISSLKIEWDTTSMLTVEVKYPVAVSTRKVQAKDPNILI